MPSIYYCPKCQGITVLPRIKVKYEYKVEVTGKTEEDLYKIPGGYMYSRPKKIQVKLHWDPNNPNTKLIKKGVEKCNRAHRSYPPCTNDIKNCIELPVTDKFCTKISDFYIGYACGKISWSDANKNPYFKVDTGKEWLELALKEDAFLAESLAFVTTLLV